MELKRRAKRLKKQQISVHRVQALTRALPDILTEDDSDLEADEDFVVRMAEIRRQREDPLMHFEGDTNVEEMYEIEEEEVQEEHEVEEEVVSQGHPKKRKGPTTRSHARLEQ